MADDRTRNQTNRVTEAAVDATKTGSCRDVARKGAETTQRAVDANAEQATRANRLPRQGCQGGPARRRSRAEQATSSSLEARSVDRPAPIRPGTLPASSKAPRTDRSSRQSRIIRQPGWCVKAPSAPTRSSTSQCRSPARLLRAPVSCDRTGRHGQQAFKRNVDTLNQALRVRSTTDLLNIQTSYLHDSLGAALNTSARISEISAETAAEAAGKLQQHQSA